MKRMNSTASMTLIALMALVAGALLAHPGTARAQAAEPAPIKVSSTLHPDGSRTETITNLEERTAEERVVNAAGKQIRRTVYTLGDDNLPNGGTHFNAENKPVSRFQYARDPMGNITEQRDYTVQGKLYQRQVNHFNTQGQLTGVETYDGQGRLIQTTGGQKKKKSVPPRRR